MGKKKKKLSNLSALNYKPRIIERAKIGKREGAVAFFLSTREFTEAQLRIVPKEVLSKESQFHFVVVNFHYDIEGWDVFIGVPILMYAYEQEVGGASVDVAEGVIAKAAEEAKAAVAPILEKVGAVSFMGRKPEKISASFLNSFHYHPSGMRNFSGSDLDTSLEDFGICYPYGKGSYEGVVHFTGLAGIRTADPYRMDCYIVSCSLQDTPLYEQVESYWILPGEWEKKPTFFREGKKLVIGDDELKNSIISELWSFWEQISFPKELYFGKEEFFKVYTPPSFSRYSPSWERERWWRW